MAGPPSAETPTIEPPAAGVVELLTDLARPAAWPAAPGGVSVLQTHCSAVFLVGDRAYKLKKPVDLGFLDFSTRARRLEACRAEVELNRRLAPDVYLGLAPIVRGPDGRLRLGEGPVVEWAVVMTRLPEERTLRALLEHGAVTPGDLRGLAARLAAFHARARRGPDVSRWARFDVVAGNCAQNFEQSRGLVGEGVSPAVFASLEARTREELERRRPLIEARAEAGVPCETHGDLRLDHVYLFPDRPPPGDQVVIDCVEFSERYRHADPVSDVAFLVMDLRMRGAWALADVLLRAYVQASGDPDAGALLPLYSSYRSVVRAKVAGLQLAEPEVGAEARAHALERVRGHFLLGLGELAPPAERPALVLVAGLPGTGKSALSRLLAARAGFGAWIRSDEVRKGLAGLDPLTRGPADLYSTAWTARTYEACLQRAQERLLEGQRVVVDATFGEERRRVALLDAARRLGVRVVVLVCEAHADAVRERLAGRTGDPSDADLRVHEALRALWEAPGPVSAPLVRRVDNGGDLEATWAQARAGLVERGLL